jgi:hypothetical protein
MEKERTKVKSSKKSTSNGNKFSNVPSSKRNLKAFGEKERTGEMTV